MDSTEHNLDVDRARSLNGPLPAVADAVLQHLETLCKNDDRAGRKAMAALAEMGEAAVPALIESLEDSDQDTRFHEVTVAALVQVGAPAVPVLIESLKNGDPGLRERVATILGSLGDPRAIPALMAALRTHHHYMPSHAVKAALEKMGEPAVLPLIEAFKDEDWSVRLGVADLLGKMGDLRATPALTQGLNDTNGGVRFLCAVGLTRIADVRALPSLIHALGDANGEVRQMAAEALGKIGDASALPALMEAIRDKRKSVRIAAAEILVTLEIQSVISDRRLSIIEKTAGIDAWWRTLPRGVRAELGSWERFCEVVADRDTLDAETKEMANAVLAQRECFRVGKSLLRPAEPTPTRQPNELLRGATGIPDTGPTDQLLKPSQTPQK